VPENIDDFVIQNVVVVLVLAFQTAIVFLFRSVSVFVIENVDVPEVYGVSAVYVSHIRLLLKQGVPCGTPCVVAFAYTLL
jgi:hypothetical protein